MMFNLPNPGPLLLKHIRAKGITNAELTRRLVLPESVDPDQEGISESQLGKHLNYGFPKWYYVQEYCEAAEYNVLYDVVFPEGFALDNWLEKPPAHAHPVEKELHRSAIECKNLKVALERALTDAQETHAINVELAHQCNEQRSKIEDLEKIALLQEKRIATLEEDAAILRAAGKA